MYRRLLLPMVVSFCLLMQGCSLSAPKGHIDKGGQCWGKPINGLQLSLQASKRIYKAGRKIEFFVTFRNVGSKDIVLNLGEMLGNGDQHLSKIGFEIIDETGKSTDLSYNPYPVGGSIGILAVPLKVGASYTVSIFLKDYSLGLTQPRTVYQFEPGVYQLVCHYEGRQTLRNPTSLKFWEGKIASNKIEFRLSEK